MKIEPDVKAYNGAIRWLAELQGKTMKEVILDQGALFCRDAIKLHPSFGKSPLKEGFGSQRAVAMKAIKRDVSRFVRSMEEGSGVRVAAISEAFKRIAKSRNTLVAEKFLRDVGFRHVAKVIDEPTAELHNSVRDKRGRVRKGMPRYVTWKESAVKRFKKRQVELMGRAKAGWLVALAGIDALRGKSTIRLPAWITRHRGEPGTFQITGGTDEKFGIVCTSQVPFAQKHVDRIQREGWTARMIAAPKQAAALYRAAMRKAAKGTP